MTCIVGLVTEEGAYIGGDSRITQDTSILPGVFEKIFFKNKILFGFCGNYRFGQILKYRFNIPELKKWISRNISIQILWIILQIV